MRNHRGQLASLVPMEHTPMVVVPDCSIPRIARRVAKYHAIRFLNRTFTQDEILELPDWQVRDIIEAASTRWGEEDIPVHTIPWLAHKLNARVKSFKTPLRNKVPRPTGRRAFSAVLSSTFLKPESTLSLGRSASAPSYRATSRGPIVDELESLETMMRNAHVASPQSEHGYSDGLAALSSYGLYGTSCNGSPNAMCDN